MNSFFLANEPCRFEHFWRYKKTRIIMFFWLASRILQTWRATWLKLRWTVRICHGYWYQATNSKVCLHPMLVVCWVLKLTSNIVVDCAKVMAIRSAILVLTNKMFSLLINVFFKGYFSFKKYFKWYVWISIISCNWLCCEVSLNYSINIIWVWKFETTNITLLWNSCGEWRSPSNYKIEDRWFDLSYLGI